MNKKELNFLLVDEDISQAVVSDKLGVRAEDVALFVRKHGIRQCDACKKRYFEPIDITDTTCARCFQLIMADFNLEFMADIGAIDDNDIAVIRKRINNVLSD